MTVNTNENSIENTLSQDKVDANVSQKINDTNVIQQKEKDAKQEEGTQEDPNWKAFREARKKDRAEREAAERKAIEKETEIAALKAAMEAAFSAKSNQVNQQQYYQEQGNYAQEETEDERIEKKVRAVIAIREAESEKKRVERELEREYQEYPDKLTKSYPDFHQTISQENLDYLDFHYSEVSRPLQRLNDGYDKWSDIYKAIKKFVPNNTTAKREAAKADVNFNKPKSMSSTGIMQSGESRTNEMLTDDKRTANWQRMQKILKGVS